MVYLIEKEIVISIVTYNSRYIFEVLDNLIEELRDVNGVSIRVFDNNSNKSYKEKLSTYSDDVELTFHNENIGFGKAHNLNLLNSNEPFFLILNPDAIVNKDGLANLVSILANNKRAAMAVPRILNKDGTTQYLIRERVSVFDYMLRYIKFKPIKKLFEKRLVKYECRHLADDEIVPIRIGSGCCMLIKSDIYKKLNGFDDRYFMYFEDYDLCLEIEKLGYQIIYNPFAKFVHFYGKEAHKNRKLFNIFMMSMYKFFNKWGWKFF